MLDLLKLIIYLHFALLLELTNFFSQATLNEDGSICLFTLLISAFFVILYTASRQPETRERTKPGLHARLLWALQKKIGWHVLRWLAMKGIDGNHRALLIAQCIAPKIYKH